MKNDNIFFLHIVKTKIKLNDLNDSVVTRKFNLNGNLNIIGFYLGVKSTYIKLPSRLMIRLLQNIFYPLTLLPCAPKPFLGR